MKGIKLNGIDAYEHFDNETIFWAGLSDPPHDIQNKAKTIDGKDYDFDGFGMCICYDWATKEFSIVKDTDLSTGSNGNLYYVDKEGDKHWFMADITKKFMKRIVTACNNIHKGKSTILNYKIQQMVLFDNHRGFVLAKNSDAAKPFVTVIFSEDKKGRRNYYGGLYYIDGDTAVNDFAARAAEYQRRYGVREITRHNTEQRKEAR